MTLEHKQLFYDSKTILQEIVQENLSHGVEYRPCGRSRTGSQQKLYSGSAGSSDQVMGQGSGRTKKAAEQAGCLRGNPKTEKVKGHR